MPGFTDLLPGDLIERNGYFMHPASIVHPEAQIGSGTRIYAFCQIVAGAIIGERCIISHGCSIFSRTRIGNGVTLKSHIDVWEEVVIEDDVFVGPSVAFTNDLSPRADAKKNGVYIATVIKRGASIGANATIVCGTTIGEYAAIAAGSVARRDVLPFTLVAGNPARFIRWVCRCNQWGRVRFRPSQSVGACCRCGREYVIENGIVHEFIKTERE